MYSAIFPPQVDTPIALGSTRGDSVTFKLYWRGIRELNGRKVKAIDILTQHTTYELGALMDSVFSSEALQLKFRITAKKNHCYIPIAPFSEVILSVELAKTMQIAVRLFKGGVFDESLPVECTVPDFTGGDHYQIFVERLENSYQARFVKVGDEEATSNIPLVEPAKDQSSFVEKGGVEATSNIALGETESSSEGEEPVEDEEVYQLVERGKVEVRKQGGKPGKRTCVLS